MAVSAWCRAVGWRLSCYGRQVFSTRVGSHMDALLTNSSQIFFVWKVCSYKFFLACARTPARRSLAPACVDPPACDLYLRKLKPCARTIFAPACLTALALKLVPSHKQESQTLCSYVARRAVPSHIQTSIKISGVKI